jgi:hypothetical protein
MHFTQNEINNILFLALKYTFRLNPPENHDIMSIIHDLQDKPTISHIIDMTFIYVAQHYPDAIDTVDKDGQLEHFRLVVREFMKLDPEIRNDLGEDDKNEESKTFH